MTSRMPYKSPFGITGIPCNMFFASLLLHLIVIAAVITTIPGASKTFTFGAPYSVALVGPEALSPHGRISGSDGLLQASQNESSVVLKRRPVALKSLPSIRKDDIDKTDIEKAISALKEKQLSGLENDATGKASSGAYATDPAGNASQTSNYSRLIWAKIKKNWTLPAALMPKSQVETIIDVRIAQSGALEYIAFEKRSGNAYFDESALRAVQKSAPFPPLTEQTTGHSIEIGIRFHSSELPQITSKDRP